MAEIAVKDARRNFSDALNRVAYAKERVILKRRGKSVVAMVPMEDLELIEALENKLDLAEARKALARAKAKGEKPVSLDAVKKQLGL